MINPGKNGKAAQNGKAVEFSAGFDGKAVWFTTGFSIFSYRLFHFSKWECRQWKSRSADLMETGKPVLFEQCRFFTGGL